MMKSLNPRLKRFSTPELLYELIQRGTVLPAPGKTVHYGKWHRVFVEIDEDHVACIDLHDEDYGALEESPKNFAVGG